MRADSLLDVGSLLASVEARPGAGAGLITAAVAGAALGEVTCVLAAAAGATTGVTGMAAGMATLGRALPDAVGALAAVAAEAADAWLAAKVAGALVLRADCGLATATLVSTPALNSVKVAAQASRAGRRRFMVMTQR